MIAVLFQLAILAHQFLRALTQLSFAFLELPRAFGDLLFQIPLPPFDALRHGVEHRRQLT